MSLDLNSSNHEVNHFALLAMVYRIEIITLPILIICGSIFNIMTFIVMRRKRMRVSSTCFYMAVLAVTDTLVLWTGCLNQWFHLLRLPTVVTKSNLTCKLLTFFFVFFADASVWIIVCMSFERFFAVSRPLLASQMCTTKRAKWILFIMFVVFLLIDGHFLLTLELVIINGKYRVCHPKEWARHFVSKIFVFIDALKYSAMPFCILLILSILIIQRVFRAQDVSAQLQNLRQLHNYRHYSNPSNPTCTSHSSTVGMGTSQSSFSNSNTRVGRRVTLMLLSVSIAFCVFSAPMSLMQILQSVIEFGRYETALAIGKAIAELCQYINHSCNFFLYALTGRIFRREFVRLFFPTRFGRGQGLSQSMRSAGMNASLPKNKQPKALSSSIHRGSSYCVENARYEINSPRTSRTIPTSYPLRYQSKRTDPSEHFFREKSPYSSIDPNPVMIDRLNYLHQQKSSVRTRPNRNAFVRFWNLFGRQTDENSPRNDSFLFAKVLQSKNLVNSTV